MTGKTGKTFCRKCFKYKTNHDNTKCPYPDYHIYPSHLIGSNLFTDRMIRKANSQ